MASAVVEIAPLSDATFKRAPMDNGGAPVVGSTHHHARPRAGLPNVKGCSPSRIALAFVFFAAVIAAFIVLVRGLGVLLVGGNVVARTALSTETSIEKHILQQTG